jgi:hypothetical protein
VIVRNVPWPLVLLLALIAEVFAYLVLFPHNGWFSSPLGGRTTFADTIAAYPNTVKIVIDLVAVLGGLLGIFYLAIIWEIGRRNYTSTHPQSHIPHGRVSGLVRPAYGKQRKSPDK